MPIPCRAVAWPSPQVIDWLRARLAAAELTHLVPDEPFRLWRLREVVHRTGLSASTIYRLMAAGNFPRPVRIDRRASSSSTAPQPSAA